MAAHHLTRAGYSEAINERLKGNVARRPECAALVRKRLVARERPVNIGSLFTIEANSRPLRLRLLSARSHVAALLRLNLLLRHEV
jgi:hypothetical protein